MTKRILPRRRRGSRRARRAIVYNTEGLMALFEVDRDPKG